ncbi:MAG: M42 family metallopeptidase [Opitutales bacterium]
MEAPEFLQSLLEARSPTGHEFEAQAVVDKAIEPVADAYAKDVLGNRIATLNPDGDPCVMLAGHIDELGLIVKYVDDNGFVYFDTLGGHDNIVISGRRVTILTKDGPIAGVTGKRAVHLMDADDRKKVPKTHEMWIDIGAKNKDEALSRVRIGDPAVYDMGLQHVHGSIYTARAFDDKTGAYVALETLRRLSADKGSLAAKLVSVATTQEEIGTRGATVSAYTVQPDWGIAIDVGHATDHPDCDARKYGKQTLGGGPILGRGPNINPLLFDKLVACAEAEGIPHQLEVEPRPTPTDARVIQMARGGCATGAISLPLRYMHTPSEVMDMEDIENAVKLLVAFVKSLKSGERGVF